MLAVLLHPRRLRLGLTAASCSAAGWACPGLFPCRTVDEVRPAVVFLLHPALRQSACRPSASPNPSSSSSAASSLGRLGSLNLDPGLRRQPRPLRSLGSRRLDRVLPRAFPRRPVDPVRPAVLLRVLLLPLALHLRLQVIHRIRCPRRVGGWAHPLQQHRAVLRDDAHPAFRAAHALLPRGVSPPFQRSDDLPRFQRARDLGVQRGVALRHGPLHNAPLLATGAAGAAIHLPLPRPRLLLLLWSAFPLSAPPSAFAAGLLVVGALAVRARVGILIAQRVDARQALAHALAELARPEEPRGDGAAEDEVDEHER